jgi:diaminopimelate decarboxylase
MGRSAPPSDEVVRALRAVAERFGTPTYAYDLDQLRAQVGRLRSTLPPAVDLLYSLKANPSLGLCHEFARMGLGADVASAGELLVALEAGISPGRICVAGPYKTPETLAHVRTTGGPILSVDSLSELETLAGGSYRYRALLRLRPEFASSAVVKTGHDSRFGVPWDELPRCRDHVASSGVAVVGFHVFAGSQVLDSDAVVRQLRGALELSLRAAEVLGVTPEILNLGGGFGVPYGPDEQELDLDPIADELARLVDRAAPARIVIELGRYLVARAGWYLTTVVGHQTWRGRSAVVVDGGVHQRTDLCGLDLRASAMPPVALDRSDPVLAPTDVLGCLLLPDDVLAESCALPRLGVGDVLGFGTAGAYGLSAAPSAFLGHPLPAEVAFDGGRVEELRPRPAAHAWLEGQLARPRSAG